MAERIQTLWPEVALFVTACVVMVVGLSRSARARRLCPAIVGVGLVGAALLTSLSTPPEGSPISGLVIYGKLLIACVGVLLLMLQTGVADREYEASLPADAKAASKRFDPLRSTTGEYCSFFVFSLMGAMLCAGADDLIWLFLALELTSLPTYVMVTISTSRNRSMEAGVKYFFLGALGAAIFLYGFALLYGATGTTSLGGIQSAFSTQVHATGSVNPLGIAGLVLAVLGLCVKIAAVPMHFYTPDVYQGAAPSVSAFLAFVPKTAGFFAILLLTATVGWRYGPGGHSLPEAVRLVLWIIAVLTMTAGNVLAILQNSVRRILAYSSIAHSGYMLVGVIAGPGESFASSGVAAVLFYLLCYGVMTVGAFAVLSALERRRADGSAEEIDSIQDLRGLCARHPVLGWTMVLSSVGLLGLPPLLGFVGKLPLFTAGIAKGEVTLVVVLGVNSAIAAFYYLRLAGVPLLEKPDPAAPGAPVVESPFASRRLAGLLSAAGVVVLWVFAGPLTEQAWNAAGTGAGRAEPMRHSAPRGEAKPPAGAEPPTVASGVRPGER